MNRSEIECWKDVPNFEGLYRISNYGNVQNVITHRILKQFNYKGYCAVNLYKKGKPKYFRVHRLVMHAFVSVTDMEINHKDGIKNNNFLGNLEYCTRSFNMKHAYATGLKNTNGIKNSRSKFKEADLIDIKKRIFLKETNKSIANIYNVCPTIISHIKRGHTYAKV